ncbi:MAG: hypothetical protein ACOCXM_12055 [Myxococcota bacterium]
MIDQRRRTIPRVAAATLTFGGTALTSCGDDGPNIISEWCEQKQSCDGSSYEYCVESYQDQLSYYGAMCAGAIGRALGCYLENVSCSELAVGDYSDCAEERDQMDAACVPPPPPPAPEGALRDFCELFIECYYGDESEYTVDECHQYYSNRMDEYVDAYGPLCGDALDALLGCYTDLTCAEFMEDPCSSSPEADRVESYCYY